MQLKVWSEVLKIVIIWEFCRQVKIEQKSNHLWTSNEMPHIQLISVLSKSAAAFSYGQELSIS